MTNRKGDQTLGEPVFLNNSGEEFSEIEGKYTVQYEGNVFHGNYKVYTKLKDKKAEIFFINYPTIDISYPEYYEKFHSWVFSQ